MEWLKQPHARHSGRLAPRRRSDTGAAFPDTGGGTCSEPVVAIREAGVTYDLMPSAVSPVEEIIDPGESRYARLAIWLTQRESRIKEVQLKFDEIEAIIGGTLPPSAREHRAWWANDTVFARAVDAVAGCWVARQLHQPFRATSNVRADQGPRERLYRFLQQPAGKSASGWPDAIKGLSPDGQSWYTFAGLPVRGREVAWLTASFARDRRLRIEVYIDTGDQAWNKRAFDLLHAQAEQIEAQLGEGLSWERLDAARASRIACYQDGSIMDAAGHAELQAWRSRYSRASSASLCHLRSKL